MSAVVSVRGLCGAVLKANVSFDSLASGCALRLQLFGVMPDCCFFVRWRGAAFAKPIAFVHRSSPMRTQAHTVIA